MLEPLRQEWAQVQATAERLKDEKRGKDAIAVVRAFHEKLCTTRVLDPACGTGNFLYVSMELMKRLEGEVNTLCRHRGSSPSQFKSFCQNNFR